MGVKRPDWWSRYHPERCSNGHDWAPGKIIVSWMLCDCSPAQAAQAAGPAGHVAVQCATPHCQSVWYKPRHAPKGG